MTNSRKRPAESAAVSTPVATATSSKKRKLDNVQKYYAVRAGRRPGIYLTYPECQAQTAGFKGAVFKSFISREDAEAFAAGKKVAAAADEPEKWYAVAVGNPTGIFRDWNDAALSIKGVKGPKYRKFSTRSEAVAYIKEHGDQDTIEALGETAQSSDKLGKRVKTSAAPPGAAPETTSTSNDILNIYTDGSSLSNGKVGARAGVGVYFGDDDPRNVAEPLDGDLQTNQRAELQAMVRALEIAPANQNVRILTDSKYSINCVTQWATGWKKKGWKTAQGEEVKNQDLIRAVLDNMKLREDAGAHTYFQWVRGHASDKGNIAADRLAVRGASMG